MYVAMYSLSLSGWLEAPYFLAGLGLYSGGMNLRMRVDQNPRLRNLESVCCGGGEVGGGEGEGPLAGEICS